MSDAVTKVVRRGEDLPCPRDSAGRFSRGATRKHGMSFTAEYRCWISVKSRCFNHNIINYHRYGGRGITVCDRWLLFENFLADMGPHPGRGYSIERLDVNGNYEPSNCVWATQREQLRNTSQNHIITFNGKTMTLVEAAEAAGLKPNTVLYRIKRGWTVPDALTLRPQRGVRP